MAATALVILEVVIARIYGLLIPRGVRLRLDRLVADSPAVALHRRNATLTDVAHVEQRVADPTRCVIGVRVVSLCQVLVMKRSLSLHHSRVHAPVEEVLLLQPHLSPYLFLLLEICLHELADAMVELCIYHPGDSRHELLRRPVVQVERSPLAVWSLSLCSPSRWHLLYVILVLL